MKHINLLFMLFFMIFFTVSCGIDDEDTSYDNTDSGDISDTGNTGDNGNTGNTGNTGENGDSGNTGNSEEDMCAVNLTLEEWENEEWKNNDADGDGIPNGYECPECPCRDRDGNEVPDYLDLDSDGDSIPDYEECPPLNEDACAPLQWEDMDCINDKSEGIPDDYSYCVPPFDSEEGCRDTSGDGTPDYLSRDSDLDGISDSDERKGAYGETTCPYLKDTDGDGSDDLAEAVYGSDPADPDDTIPVGIFYVVLPYNGVSEVERELTFSTNIEAIDVMFVIDASGSMFEEIDKVRENIKTEIISSIKDEFSGDKFAAFGLSRITFANSGEFMRQKITLDENEVENALDNFGENGGFAQGIAELHSLPLYYNANPEGFTGTAKLAGLGPSMGEAPIHFPSADCSENLGSIGHACFRKESMPIYIYITDAESADCGTPEFPNCSWKTDPGLQSGPTLDQAIDMMNAIGVKFIGINTWHEFQGDGSPADGEDPIENMILMANRTGSLNLNGEPFIYQTEDNEGNGMPTHIADAIIDLTTYIDMDVTTGKMAEEDQQCDGISATEFIKSSTTEKAVPENGVSDFDETTFFSVKQGTEVVFNVKFYNDFCRNQSPKAKIYEAKVTVLGNGSFLSSRLVHVVVPPGDMR